MLIGYTSGFMYKTINTFSPQAIKVCESVCSDAIEINCIAGLSEGSMSAFSIPKKSLASFQYVSLHAPCKIKYGDNKETSEVLSKLSALCNKLLIETVVFHPDTIEDWSLFANLDFSWAVENMDNRKNFYRKPSDFEKIFSKFNCGFVLDLNHCFSNDASMRLAEEFICKFGDRLYEIHLSGFREYHELLCDTEQLNIMSYVPKETRVPIILEGVCNNINDVAREYNYVRNFLFQKH